jgi:hypothetical protein
LRGDDEVMGAFPVRGAPTGPRRPKPEITYAGSPAASPPPPVRLNPVRKSRGRVHHQGILKKPRYKAFDA